MSNNQYEALTAMSILDANVATSTPDAVGFMGEVIGWCEAALDECGRDLDDPTVAEAVDRHVAESIDGSSYLTATYLMWRTFTALCLYQTDYVNSPNPDPDMTEAAKAALYQFASELATTHLYRKH